MLDGVTERSAIACSGCRRLLDGASVDALTAAHFSTDSEAAVDAGAPAIGLPGAAAGLPTEPEVVFAVSWASETMQRRHRRRNLPSARPPREAGHNQADTSQIGCRWVQRAIYVGFVFSLGWDAIARFYEGPSCTRRLMPARAYGAIRRAFIRGLPREGSLVLPMRTSPRLGESGATRYQERSLL